MGNENKAKTISDFEKEWRSLPLTDDFMFTKVFSDENLCKGLIELLLGVKVKKLNVPPEYQKVQKTSPEAKGVRFDVYTESEDSAFDIEIQTTKQKDLPLRMRYYQSSMDTGLIKQGQKYSDLKQTYVLFISTIDQFGYDEPVYEIVSYIKGHPEYTFNDRRKEVVYNLSACDKIKDGKTRSLLRFISGKGEAKMEFEKQVKERFNKIKDDEYWRNNYISVQLWKQDADTRGYERGIQQGIAQQKAEDEKTILAERKKLSQRDAEIEKQAQRIKELEALLQSK